MVGSLGSVGPGALGPSSSSTHFRFSAAGQTVDFILAIDPETNLPVQWVRSTSPVVTPVLNTSNELTEQSVPPDQGLEGTIGDVSGGAGSSYAKPGRYAFGRHINTSDGKIEPGPALSAMTLTSGGALDGPIKANTFHHDYTFFVAGKKVYKKNHDANTCTETATQPAVTHNATDIMSFGRVDLAALLVVMYDNDDYWFVSGDDGATWQSSADFGVAADVQYGKHVCRVQQNSLRPVMCMVRDPNLFFTTEDPTQSDLWVGPDYVGDPDTQDSEHFTGVFAGPGTRLFAGKETNCYERDESGNWNVLIGPVIADSGQGLENFAWMQQMGGDVWVQVQEYDIVRITPGEPVFGYGPFKFGQDIPEMQKAVKAMTTDNVEWVYVALSGTEGDVMRFRIQNGEIAYHGAYVSIGTSITNKMWFQSEPAATDKNRYLYVCPTGTPYLPYRALIPQGDNDVDGDARFAGPSLPWIRFGYQTGGREQVTKLLLSSVPVSRNLDEDEAEITLYYRTNYGAAFTEFETFDESPMPSDLSDAQYQVVVSGNVWEIKAQLFGNDTLDRPILDKITTRALWRYPESSLVQRVDTLRFTVTGEQAIGGVMGGRTLQASKGLYERLKDGMGSIPLTSLIRVEDQKTWVGDLLSVTERVAKRGQGYASGMWYDLVFQELPGAVALTIFHKHTLDYFTGDGIETTFVLSGVPFGPTIVFVDDEFQVIGPFDDYTVTGVAVTFAVAPPSLATIRVHFPIRY